MAKRRIEPDDEASFYLGEDSDDSNLELETEDNEEYKQEDYMEEQVGKENNSNYDPTYRPSSDPGRLTSSTPAGVIERAYEGTKIKSQKVSHDKTIIVRKRVDD